VRPHSPLVIPTGAKRNGGICSPPGELRIQPSRAASTLDLHRTFRPSLVNSNQRLLGVLLRSVVRESTLPRTVELHIAAASTLKVFVNAG